MNNYVIDKDISVCSVLTFNLPIPTFYYGTKTDSDES